MRTILNLGIKVPSDLIYIDIGLYIEITNGVDVFDKCLTDENESLLFDNKDVSY